MKLLHAWALGLAFKTTKRGSSVRIAHACSADHARIRIVNWGNLIGRASITYFKERISLVVSSCLKRGLRTPTTIPCACALQDKKMAAGESVKAKLQRNLAAFSSLTRYVSGEIKTFIHSKALDGGIYAFV